MRKAILLTAAFVVAALALSLLVPTEELQLSPFVQNVRALDTRVDSREFAVTVTGARLADRVQTPDWTGTTSGVWLLVDIAFERRLDRGPIGATLRIGDTDYAISERPESASIDNASSLPGLAWAGTMLVELPTSAIDAPGADAAVMRFTTQFDPILDGVVDYTFDLATLDHVDSVTLFEPARVAS